ncbi:MAG: hypothetical protein RIS76_2014 [Verrucomicrobiota bacterium]
MASRRKVLFVDHAPGPLGGAEVNLVELLSHPAARLRWDAQVACAPAGALAAALARHGVVRHDYQNGPLGGAPRPAAGRIRTLFRLGGRVDRKAAANRLRDIIAGFQPDAVVSCSSHDHFAAGTAAAEGRVPSVWWVNENLSADFFSWPARRSFASEAVARATRLIPVSAYGRDALVAAGIPADRITVIHNGLPLRQYRRSPSTLLRDQLRLTPGEPLIGLLGKVTPWKGQQFFVELAERWAAQRRPGRFIICGPVLPADDTFSASLRDYVRTHRLGNRVRFLPPPPTDAATLSQLDVLLHCSLKPEPFGRVIIEGMAVGVPVIAARDGGVPEIITPGVDGGLARPGNHEEYLAQLTALLGNTVMREGWITSGRRTVQQRFTLERVFADFEQVFLGLAPG